MSKRFLFILAIIVLIFGGLLIINKREASNSGGSANNNDKSLLSQHVQKGDSGVTLVEYGDFQCPGCGGMFPIFKQLKEKYSGRVTFQFRHFPLVSIHPFALLAAKSAEAASMQGKFWEMHDKLFENQQTWSSSSNPNSLFEEYAQQIGLNIDKFRQDAKSEKVNSIVMADKAEAERKGLKSTPSFELDGKQIKATTYNEFVKLIDEALHQKQSQ